MDDGEGGTSDCVVAGTQQHKRNRARINQEREMFLDVKKKNGNNKADDEEEDDDGGKTMREKIRWLNELINEKCVWMEMRTNCGVFGVDWREISK